MTEDYYAEYEDPRDTLKNLRYKLFELESRKGYEKDRAHFVQPVELAIRGKEVSDEMGISYSAFLKLLQIKFFAEMDGEI